MKNRLSQLEARMEALVEGTFARLFQGRLQPREIGLQLARALEDSLSHGAPAVRYVVRLNPADAQALLGEQPRLAESLADDLVRAARELPLTLPALPEILFVPDAVIKPHSVVVTAEAASLTDTAATPPQAGPGSGPLAPPCAFLILEGERTLPLDQAIISLGRRLDNHIIIDDPRVSRAHAQLRLRFGRYMLYDLGSTGGTFVNGQRVQECVLRPGDVISLAGVSIIYGEDEAAPGPPLPPTRPLPAEAPRRPDFPTLPPDRETDPNSH
jgi:hypothetical protein